MIIRFVSQTFDFISCFINFIKMLIGPSIVFKGSIESYSKEVNLNVYTKDGKRIVDIQGSLKDAEYQVVIYEPLVADPRLFKRNYLDRFFVSVSGRETFDFFSLVKYIRFEDLKLRPILKLLSLKNYSIQLVKIKSGTEDFEIFLRPEDFPVDIVCLVVSVLNNAIAYTSVYFNVKETFLEDKNWVMKLVSKEEILKFDYFFYFVFQVLIDVVDPSAPGYLIIKNLYSEFESIIKQSRQKYFSENFYVEENRKISYTEDYFDVSLPISSLVPVIQPLHNSPILISLVEHFSGYEVAFSSSMAFSRVVLTHPSYPLIQLDVSKKGTIFYLVFKFKNFKENYQAMNTPLLDIFSFFTKHSRDPGTIIFKDETKLAKIVYSITFNIESKYVNLRFLYDKGFRYEDNKNAFNYNVFSLIESRKDKGFLYVISYFPYRNEMLYEFHFFISNVIRDCGSTPTTYIHDIIKEVVNNTCDKKIVNYYTGAEIDLFSVPREK